MNRFDVQGVELATPIQRAFAYIADPCNLPRWAQAFASADAERASLRTQNGEVEIALTVAAVVESGTIDWRMAFPDGSVARAHSRLVELDPSHCAYTFVLTAPPVPLEQLEGALAAQSKILRHELATLKDILDHAR